MGVFVVILTIVHVATGWVILFNFIKLSNLYREMYDIIYQNIKWYLHKQDMISERLDNIDSTIKEIERQIDNTGKDVQAAKDTSKQ